MRKNFSRAPAAARIIGLAASVLAAATAAEAQKATTQVAPRPAAAQKAAAEAPARTEIKTLDAWSLTCRYGKDDKKIGCAALLRVTEKDHGKVVLVWTLGKSADGKIVGALETLTGVLIQPGVEIKLGSSATRVLPFTACTNAGCFANFAVDDAFLKEAASATTVEATILGVDSKKYTFTFSPKGMDKAIAAIRG